MPIYPSLGAFGVRHLSHLSTRETLNPDLILSNKSYLFPTDAMPLSVFAITLMLMFDDPLSSSPVSPMIRAFVSRSLLPDSRPIPDTRVSQRWKLPGTI